MRFYFTVIATDQDSDKLTYKGFMIEQKSKKINGVTLSIQNTGRNSQNVEVPDTRILDIQMEFNV